MASGILPPDRDHNDGRDRLNTFRLTPVTVSVVDANGDTLFGAQCVYTHPNLRDLTMASRTEVVQTQAAPVAGFSVLRNTARGIEGDLVISYLGLTIYDGPASDLFSLTQPDAILTTELVAPDEDLIGTDNPTLVTFTVTSENTPGGLLLSWDTPADQEYAYRIYVGDNEHTLFAIGHTVERSFLIRDVAEGQILWAYVRAENRSGYLSRSSTPVQYTYSQTGSAQGFIRRQMLRSATIAAGGSLTVDLTQVAYPTALKNESDSISARWAASTIAAEVIGIENIDASISGTDLILTAPGGAVSLGGYNVVLVKLTRGTLATPVWLGMVVSLDAATAYTAYNVSMAHAANHTLGASVDASKLVGDNAAVSSSSFLSPRRLRVIGAAENTDGTFLAQPTGTLDTIPEVSIFEGDDGYGLLLFQTNPGRRMAETPFLPAGTATKYEAGGVWQDVNLTTTLRSQALVQNMTWPRVLVGTTLYDTTAWAPPEEVYYAAPIFYGTTWFDAVQYPADATFAEGQVAYRSGLKTAVASATPPTITELQATAFEQGVRITWTATNPHTGNPTTITVPVFVKRAGGTAQSKAGRNSVAFDKLAAGMFYHVYMFTDGGSPSTSFTTIDVKAGVAITGELRAEGRYAYTYTLTDLDDDAITGWTDAFGTSHTDLVVSLEADELQPRQTVVITHTSGRTYSLQADVAWQYPPNVIAFARLTTTGHVLPENRIPEPLFSTARFTGTVDKTLAPNLYKAGRVTAVAEGFLPGGLTGELEDYVTLHFVDPDGQELASTVLLEIPMELAVRIRVTASEGLSPLIYGVRVHWQ